MNEEVTQRIRVEEREFISCRYVRTNSTSKATVQWITPTAVFVSIELAGEGPEKNLRRTWDGGPEDAEQIQAMLAAVEERKGGPSADFTLHLFRRGDQFATLAWAASDETDALAGLRASLERAGHLACVEAMACFRRGHAFGEGGAYSQAIEALRKGIASLGNSYRNLEAIDDTGMRLALAESYEKTGEIELARNIFERALKTRIDEYLNAHSLESSIEQWDK